MSLGLASREVVVDGIRLPYVEREPKGASTGAPILLLHGLLASAGTFSDLMEHLPEDRLLVALDLLAAVPLGGESKLDVSFQGLAALILRFAEAIGLDGPVVLGHSHGGVLALQMAARRPERLSALALLCPAHPFSGYHEKVVRFYVGTFGGTLAKLVPRLPRRFLYSEYVKITGPNSRMTRKQFEPYLTTLRSPIAISRVLHMLQLWDKDMKTLRAALEQSPVALPALLVWGASDPVVPVGSAAKLQEHLPGAERVILPGIGHLPAEEAAADCGAAVTAWLAAVSAGSIMQQVS